MKKQRLAIFLAAATILSSFPSAAFAAEREPARLPDEPAPIEAPVAEAPADDPEPEPMTVPQDLLTGSPAQSAPEGLTQELDQSLVTVELPQDENSQLLLAAADQEDGGSEGSGVPAMKMDLYQGETFAGSLYFTSSGTEATLAYGENLNGAIQVPERFEHEGTTYRVTDIGRAALCNQTGLTQLWLPNDLKEIGSKAFSGCDHLKAVGSYEEGGSCDPYALPDGLTDIWPETFYGCTRLSSVKIGAQVTDIWHYAFAYCYSLGQNYTDASGVTYGVYFDEGSRLHYINQGAFQSCIVLDNIALPEGLAYIGPDAFHQCTAIMERDGKEEYVGLKNVVIPDSVKTIGEKAFMYCFTLDTLSIPATVETIGDKAFYSCSHLRDLEFRGTGAKKIEMGTMAFYWCRSLESIRLPANLETLPAWTFAYAGYYGQPDVVLPEGMVKVDQYAFNESGIRSITFPSTIAEVAMLAFGDCHNLREINWPEKKPGDDPVSLGMMAFTDCESLTSVTLPKLHITTGDNLFYDCDNLRTVTVAEGAAFIPKSAFRDCGALTVVTLPESLTAIHSQAFYTCPSLTDVDLSTAAGLQTIGKLAFCRTALREVAIPASVKNIGEEAFGINRALTGFTVAQNSAGGYYAEHGTLYQRKTVNGAEQVRLVRYPAGAAASVYDIPAGVTHIDSGACSHSEHLTAVTFPASLKAIGDYAFSHCINLKTAEVGSGVSQGARIFDQCFQLTTVTIPEGTTVIGGDGYDPTALSRASTITIPASVTAIYAGGMHISGVPAVGSNFQNLPLLEAIEVAPGSQNFVSVDGVLFTKDMTTLIAYPVAKAGETYTVPGSVTTIAAYAFQNVSHLKRVIVPAGVESISVNALYAPLERVDFYRDFTEITSCFASATGYCKMFDSEAAVPVQVYVHGDPTDPAGTEFIQDFTKSGAKESNIHIGFLRPVAAAGDKFHVDGVTYTLSDPAAKTVTVGANPNYAKSQVTIPAQVSYEGTAYTVTAVEAGAFTEAANLTAASVMLPAAQIDENAFDSSVAVTSRDAMTGFSLNTRSLSYGDQLVVSTPGALAEGTAVTLTGSKGSVSAAVKGGTAVFPVNQDFYDAVDSRGRDVTVTLSGGGIATEGVHMIVSPKTYGPDDVPWYNPSVHTYFISKPYDGTNVVDVTTSEPLAGFLEPGDDVAIRFYNGTCCYIEAAPNLNDIFRGDLELVGGDAGYYAISNTLKARPQDYFACHVDFGQLYIKEVDGVLQRPLFRRVWSSEDGMRVRDCGLGGGQFVAYLPTKTEGGAVTEYETVDVDGYFVYTDPNPYPAFQDSGDFPVQAGSVYSWDFIPSGNDNQELLKNYRFSGTFMPWDPSLSKDESDADSNNLVGQAGENPPLPGYVKPAQKPQETQDPAPARPTGPDTTPVQDTPASPEPTPAPAPDNGSDDKEPAPQQPIPTSPENPEPPVQTVFSDVTESWAKEDIEFVAARRLMVGTGKDVFSPKAPMTGAMAVTVLGRLAGAAEPEEGQSWYQDYVSWAEEQGLLFDGFTPKANITREEMAYLLSQYLGGKASDSTPLPYSDADQIDPAYRSGVRLLYELDVMHGRKDGSFHPQGQLTRAELAAILHRLILSELL